MIGFIIGTCCSIISVDWEGFLKEAGFKDPKGGLEGCRAFWTEGAT